MPGALRDFVASTALVTLAPPGAELGVALFAHGGSKSVQPGSRIQGPAVRMYPFLVREVVLATLDARPWSARRAFALPAEPACGVAL